MSETTEQNPAGDVQPPAEDKTDAERVQLLEAKNRQLLSEKQAVQQKLKDIAAREEQLQQREQSRKQADLLASGQAEVLVEQLRGTVSEKDKLIQELEQKLVAKDVAFEQQQIKASAMNAFSKSGVHAPEDLFNLEKDNLRLKDGDVVALVGGVEVPLHQRLESLKAPGSGRDYFFVGSGARGMSAGGTTSSASGGKSWGSMGLMERIQLEEENPQLAAQLKAQG